MLTQEKFVWFIVVFLAGLIVGVGGMTLTKRTQPAPIIIHPPDPTPTPEPTATAGPMRVYVNGNVSAPAVYELPPGSLVEDAILAAGGFTDEANTAVVNLAQPLNDGDQLYVPAAGEDVLTLPVVTTKSNTVSNQDSSSTNPSGLININTATMEELDSLPGVGPSTAQKIIAHREEQGLFTSVEAIMDVSGIGDAKFGQIEALITVEGE